MGKNPAFQFYPDDWQSDPELQSCSISARGVMIELMCLMHRATPYGYLKVGGKTPPDPATATLVRVRLDLYRRSLKELLEKGVLKRDHNKNIYSKRMVEDEKRRKVRQESGKRGGSPLLKVRRKHDLNQDLKVQTKHDLNQNSTPSSPSPSLSLNESSGNVNKLRGENPPPGNIAKKKKPPNKTPPIKIPWATVEYQGEQLAKLEGRRIKDPKSFQHPDRALHINIAMHFPYAVIHQALEFTQDAVLEARSGHRIMPNVRAYYVGTLKHIAQDKQIKLPKSWADTGSATKKPP